MIISFNFSLQFINNLIYVIKTIYKFAQIEEEKYLRYIFYGQMATYYNILSSIKLLSLFKILKKEKEQKEMTYFISCLCNQSINYINDSSRNKILYYRTELELAKAFSLHLNSEIFKIILDQVEGSNLKEKFEKAEIEYKNVNTIFRSGNFIFKNKTIVNKILPLLINKNVRYKELYLLMTISKLKGQNIATTENYVIEYINSNLLKYIEGFGSLLNLFQCQKSILYPFLNKCINDRNNTPPLEACFKLKRPTLKNERY